MGEVQMVSQSGASHKFETGTLWLSRHWQLPLGNSRSRRLAWKIEAVCAHVNELILV